MKKHNFLHRGIGWIKRELEATLAILILLSAVFGYTLAGTETVTNTLATPDLTTQEASASSFVIGTNSYDSLAFDSTFIDGKTYRVRKLSLQPSTASTIAGIGLQGTTSSKYTATINLASSYSGKVYVIGDSIGATLNGTTITNQDTAVFVADATQLILNFDGIKHSFRAISTLSPNTAPVSNETIANLAVLPSTTIMFTRESRRFIVIATDQAGSSISSSQLSLNWTLNTIPNEIATINQDGLVTTTEAGVITVKVIAGGKSASASITVVSKPIAVTPATTPTTSPSTTTSPDKTATETSADNGSQSILDKITQALTGGPADATTSNISTTIETKSVIAQAIAVAVAAYSPAVVAERFAKTGSAIANQAEIKAIVGTQTTITGRIATRFGLVLNEMKQSFTEIAVGNKILGKPSAIKSIANFISGLFIGAKGSGATGGDTMSAVQGNEDDAE